MRVAGTHREPQAKQLDEDVAFGVLRGGPAVSGPERGQVRRGAGQGTGKALGGGVSGVDHPVTLVGRITAGAWLEAAAREGGQRTGVGRGGTRTI